MELDEDTQLAPAEGVAFRAMREGGVVLHLGTGQYHGFDDVGVLIWRLLDGRRTLAEVAALVAGEVTDPPHDLYDHVREFAAGLLQRKLVR